MLHLLVLENFQMSENLQGFSGNEFQLSVPKTKAMDVQESGICPKAAPHGHPTSRLGSTSSSRPWQILSQGFHKSFSSPSRAEAAWLLHLFLSGKQQRQCCARHVAGFELELHSLFTGIYKNTFQLSRTGRKEENSTWTFWE